jgi:hypothetical protein
MLFQYGAEKLWTVVFNRGGAEKPGIHLPAFLLLPSRLQAILPFAFWGALPPGIF